MKRGLLAGLMMAAMAGGVPAFAQVPPHPAQPDQPSQAAHAPPQQIDPRLAETTIEALQSMLKLRETQLRVLADDAAQKLRDLDAAWKAEFAGWCGNRPACGLTPHPPMPHS